MGYRVDVTHGGVLAAARKAGTREQEHLAERRSTISFSLS
jgi:hypothetical protein